MMLSTQRPLTNRVKELRRQRGWSQDQLAQRAGISRAAVSAIEVRRLIPSVAAALALARAFACPVESLFGLDPECTDRESWAWLPPQDPCRFWRAEVGGQVLRFPLEDTVAGILPHDGVWSQGKAEVTREMPPDRTLVLVSCDPAVGLLAREYEHATGFRLLPLYRSSRVALSLLGQGLVHVAGIHLATAKNPQANEAAARSVLGSGYSLVRAATWDEGLAVGTGVTRPSVNGLLRANVRWIGRERGAAARECQDEILAGRAGPRRVVRDHRGVAETIRNGWADVGVCLRLVSEQAGLRFVQVRQEAYDLCFASSMEQDIRLKQLMVVLRSHAIGRMFSSLPGYELMGATERRTV
jgi:molybdate-binding protein/DNA-binding XRE family transcriptional regulator